MSRLRKLEHDMYAAYESLIAAESLALDRLATLAASREAFDTITSFVGVITEVVEGLNPGHGPERIREMTERLCEALRRLVMGLQFANDYERKDDWEPTDPILRSLANAIGGAGWNVRDAHEIMTHGHVVSPGYGWPVPEGPAPIFGVGMSDVPD